MHACTRAALKYRGIVFKSGRVTSAGAWGDRDVRREAPASAITQTRRHALRPPIVITFSFCFKLSNKLIAGSTFVTYVFRWLADVEAPKRKSCPYLFDAN